MSFLSVVEFVLAMIGAGAVLVFLVAAVLGVRDAAYGEDEDDNDIHGA
jgi:hypothetical protein